MNSFKYFSVAFHYAIKLKETKRKWEISYTVDNEGQCPSIMMNKYDLSEV